MATETDRLAKSVIGDTPTEMPSLILRLGEVKATDPINGKVDITLGGASGAELIPGVRHLSNYRPQVDDPVWVLVSGPDLLVIDRTSIQGPSVISDANSAAVDTEQTRTSTAWGDLATVGPQIPGVNISPSGKLLISWSAWMSNDNSAGGALMGVQLTQTFGGTYTRAPDQIYSAMVNKIGSGKPISGQYSMIMTGVPAGKYTITCKYAVYGSGTARYRWRWLSVIPL